MRIGFIGAGKVGVSLGKYFVAQGPRSNCGDIQLTGYYSKNSASAKWAADFTDSQCYSDMMDLVSDSDWIFLTVPDGQIEVVAGELAKKITENLDSEILADKVFCHCSGAENSLLMESLREKGGCCYSVHPICAVSSKEFGYLALKDACFTVEGDQKHLEELHKFFTEMGNQTEIIEPDKKVQYHLAAVFASNLVVGLYEEATGLLKECGLSDEFAKSALIPLFVNNGKNIADKGTVEALTGPVERGDVGTVQKHLQVVSDGKDVLYRLLSLSLVEVAKKKNPDRDYKELEELLRTTR